jgi:hypothetical protein
MVNNSLGLKTVSELACIAYDPANGDVLHVHVVTSLEGAEIPSKESVRAATLEHYQHLFQGPRRAKVETVFVEPAELEKPGMRRIDPSSRKLMVLPPE